MTISAQFDRVKFSVSGTPALGAVTVGAAVTGFRTPAGASIPNSTVCTWLAVDGTAWEVWQGAYTSAGTSIARTTLLQSSTGGSISLTSAAVVACVNAAEGGLTIANGIIVTGSGLVLTADAADQTISGGANISPANLGTKSSGTLTIDCGTCQEQYVINGGAFTLASPANDGSCMLLVTNNGSAGTITPSGFSNPTDTGNALDTINGHMFTLSIWRINGVSGYRVAAHQN